MSDIEQKITGWIVDRNLHTGSTQSAQMVKLMEEVGELAHAVARGKSTEDAIGDCAVVLSVLALQSGRTLTDCMTAAYEEIKDRKGKMVDGVFIKEEDMQK